MLNLKEDINNFLFYLKKVRAYASSSIDTYDNVLKELLLLGHYYEEDKEIILDITPLRLKNINNSKRTISKKLSAIRSFVKYMKEQQNLSIKLIGDSSIKVPQTLPKPIDENLISEVLNHASKKEHLIIALLYGLGLRISELSTLTLNDISQEWVEVRGKGDKARQIPLLKSLFNELEDYIKQEKPKVFLLEKEGEKMTVNQIRYLFNKLFKKYGIKATPHQLRHSYATHMLHNGARISDVSELLGHSSMVSTQIYTKLSSNKKLNTYSMAHPLCQNDKSTK